MRWSLVLILFMPLCLFAQKKGQLTDVHTGDPIGYAHIQNLSQGVFAVSDENGAFTMPMQLSDSLWISRVGYEAMGVIIGQEWAAASSIDIQMNQDTIILEDLTIGAMPSEKVFKQRILSMDPEEEQEFYGIENVDVGTSILLEDKVVKSLGYAIMHPVGFVYHSLSKKEKEKRKMHQIEQRQHQSYQIRDKYNREYIADLTKLQDDRLTDFIAFCAFTDEFLSRSTQYQIAEAIMDKYDQFIDQGKG